MVFLIITLYRVALHMKHRNQKVQSEPSPQTWVLRSLRFLLGRVMFNSTTVEGIQKIRFLGSFFANRAELKTIF